MPNETLSIDLSDDMAQMIRHAIDAGDYGSSSDVVTDALRLWQQRQQRLEGIRAGLDAAAADPMRFSDEEVSAYLDRLLAAAEAPPVR